MGCRLNQSEGDALQAQLVAQGHQVVEHAADADVYLLNSCTITHQADADARRSIRRARRENPAIKVLVTGCWADGSPQEVERVPGVEWVVGNAEKADVAQLFGPAAPGTVRPRTPGVHVAVSALRRRGPVAELPPAIHPSRTRPLLKVQDGCDYRCSFCIVPSVRGRSRSLPVHEVLRSLDAMVRAGAPEVVLTGIHLGTYGRDLKPRITLVGLVEAAIARLHGARLRLSSVDPHEVGEDLVALLRDHPAALCRHLHLPVQSGDSEVLRAMRRAHTPAHFSDGVHRLVTAVPGIAIGTDVIVGFPGESEQAFSRTYDLLQSLPLAYLHVFPYSRRRDTVAAVLPNQVRPAVLHARSLALRQLSTAKKSEFRRTLGDSTVAAVVYRRRDRQTGSLVALTDNYVEFRVEGPDAVLGKNVVLRVDSDGATARLVGP